MAAPEMRARATMRRRDDVLATVSGERFDGSEYAFRVVAMATVRRWPTDEKTKVDVELRVLVDALADNDVSNRVSRDYDARRLFRDITVGVYKITS